MFKVSVDQWCEGCPDFEADVEKVNGGRNMIIRCKHRCKCVGIKLFLEDRDEEEKQPEKVFICGNTGLKCIFCCPGACIARKVRVDDKN